MSSRPVQTDSADAVGRDRRFSASRTFAVTGPETQRTSRRAFVIRRATDSPVIDH